jgi:spore germination cell wall hydrolase CwlJ-like protein
MKTILLFALIWLRGCALAPAGEIDARLATRAIVGEAASEPFLTQLAIAGAIRNRGTLAGVLGANNGTMIDRQTTKTFATALRAWNESATNNPVHGASYWESTNFKTPHWARKMKCVAHVGRFNFYQP